MSSTTYALFTVREDTRSVTVKLLPENEEEGLVFEDLFDTFLDVALAVGIPEAAVFSVLQDRLASYDNDQQIIGRVSKA